MTRHMLTRAIKPRSEIEAPLENEINVDFTLLQHPLLHITARRVPLPLSRMWAGNDATPRAPPPAANPCTPRHHRPTTSANAQPTAPHPATNGAPATRDTLQGSAPNRVLRGAATASWRASAGEEGGRRKAREGDEGAGDDGSPFELGAAGAGWVPRGFISNDGPPSSQRLGASALAHHNPLSASLVSAAAAAAAQHQFSIATGLGLGDSVRVSPAYLYNDAQGCSSDAPRAIGTGAVGASQRQATDGRHTNGRREWAHNASTITIPSPRTRKPAICRVLRRRDAT
ncbi:hypothetical protein BJ912DRAFT_923095 [Pholiota molesta]|nr:hypothetical protein BJ912DRAFT_923095 [Pholiota molesta]